MQLIKCPSFVKWLKGLLKNSFIFLKAQNNYTMQDVYIYTYILMSNFFSPCWLTRSLVFPLCLGILSVLSLSSECTSLASELPKVSYVKAIDIWLIACLLFGFASLVEYAVVQVMLNSPKRIEAEKAKMAAKEKAAGKSPAARNNTVNGTGGTPLHVSTLHVSGSGLITVCVCVCVSVRNQRNILLPVIVVFPISVERDGLVEVSLHDRLQFWLFWIFLLAFWLRWIPYICNTPCLILKEDLCPIPLMELCVSVQCVFVCLCLCMWF